MLVLTRRVGETIVMDGGIMVRVLGLQKDRVKLGIIAPDGVAILREELIPSAVASPKPDPFGTVAIEPGEIQRELDRAVIECDGNPE